MKAERLANAASCVGEALCFERELPGNALFLYRRAEKLNVEFSKSILISAIVAPMLASILAFHLTIRLDQYQTLSTIGILAILGFGIPCLFLCYQDRRRGMKTRWYDWLLAPFFGFYFVFATLWTVLLAAVMGAISVLPIFIVFEQVMRFRAGVAAWDISSSAAHAVRETSLDYAFPIVAVASFTVMALLVVDVHPRILNLRRVGVRILGAGLVLSWENAAALIAGLAIGAVLAGAGPLGVLHDHIWEGIAAAGAAGTFLGCSLARGVRDIEMRDLINLGRARCNIRCRRLGFAGYPFSWRWGWTLSLRPYLSFGAGSAGECLTESLSFLIFPGQYQGEEDLPDIESLVCSAELRATGRNRDLWRANADATRVLARDQQALWKKGLLPRLDSGVSRPLIYYVALLVLVVAAVVAVAVLRGTGS